MLDVVFELVEVGHLANGFFQLVFDLFQVVLGNFLGWQFLESGQLGGARRVLEVAADGLLYGLAGVHQPEHDEQGHHRGDEIGISNLPGAAVVAAMTAFAFDDDGLRAGGGHGLSRYEDAGAGSAAGPAPGPAAASPAASPSAPAGAATADCLQAASNSAKVGRRCAGMARRPISAASSGAVPFMKAIMETRSTWRYSCSSCESLAKLEEIGPM